MKNSLIGILSLVAVGSFTFGYIQKGKWEDAQATCASEKQALEKLAYEQQRIAKQFQEMAEVARHDAEVQRTICEEQLKTLKTR